MTTPFRGHERIYRGLLRLYPAGYRQKYTEPMIQLFADQLRDQGAGISWLAAMGDVPRSALSEHVRRNRNVAHSMSVEPTRVSRVLGALGVIGGLVLVAAFVVEISPDANLLRLALFNIGAIAVAIGAHRLQASASPRLALSAVVPVVMGNALYLATVITQALQVPWPSVGPFYLVLAPLMWLGDLWFGVITFRLGVLNRLASLALIVGAFFAFVGMGIFGLTVSGTLLNTVIMAGFAVQGLGWIALGLDVALRHRQPASA